MISFAEVHEFMPAAPPAEREQWSEMIPLTPALQIAPVKRLLELALLPPNWDGENSPPVVKGVVLLGLMLLSRAAAVELPPPFIAPISGGGAHFEWQRGRRGLKIAIFADAPPDYLKTEVGRPPEEGLLKPAVHELKSLFGWLAASAS